MTDGAGILIIGAGGHAKVVADILNEQGSQIVGYLDDNPQTWNTTLLNIPVLGPINSYKTIEHAGIIIAIGSNTIRRTLVSQINADTLVSWCNAIHSRAVIASSAKLGCGTVIVAGAVINPDSSIGDHVIINTGATVDHDCTIGSYCHIAQGVHLSGGVQVGEGTLIAVGAVVLPYHKIGCNVTIEAGAVVTSDVPDGATVSVNSVC